MNKKTFKYLFILFVFLIVININIISASEINDVSAISDQMLADDSGVDELEYIDGNININAEDGENTNEGDGNSANPSDTNENDNSDPSDTTNTDNPVVNSDTSTESATTTTQKTDTTNKITLKKTYISSLNYTITSKGFKVYLKDSNKKAIPNKTIKLTVAGKNYTAKTDNTGTAKFNVKIAAKTYNALLRFEGDSTYKNSTKKFYLRVISNPIYTKLSIEETGIIKDDRLKIYLKNADGKIIPKQTIKISINNKNYTRKINEKGYTTLKMNFSSKIYDVTITFAGKGNYIATTKKAKVNVLNSKRIGTTSYGKVDLIGIIGNRSSKIKIAYVVGLHPREHQAHDSVYKFLKNKVNMKYKYYIYKITLTKKSGDYSVDRMRGQKLAKNYIVPHAKKQNYKVVIDIHSTTGVAYAKTYFIHVPQNKHKASMKYAKKTIKMIQSIEKNSKMVYWSPKSQTSPPYIHLPLIKAGTPTFVFETWTYEKKSQTDKRAKILIQAVDKIFG